MARILMVTAERIDVYDKDNYLFSVETTADLLYVKIRQIQLASIIRNKWITSEADILSALDTLMNTFECVFWEALIYDFGIYDISRKSVVTNISELYVKKLDKIFRTDCKKFIFCNNVFEKVDILNQDISVLKFPREQVLRQQGITKVVDLTKVTAKELKYFDGIGKQSLDYLENELKKFKLSFKDDGNISLLKFTREYILRKNNIKYIKDLKNYTMEEILSIKGIGPKTLGELMEKMAEFEIQFKGDGT